MKPWLKKIMSGCLGVSVFGVVTVGVVIWSLVSWLGTGYDNDGQKIVFHTLNNTTWRVVRSDVKGADPTTFRAIRGAGGQYGVDDQNAFYETTQFDGADVETFEVLDWRQAFSRDKNHAYFWSIKVSDDPAHFQVLTQSYSKDQQRVYYMHHVIGGADPETFAVTSEVTAKAKDKHGSYAGHKRRE